jgi:hypothetical protein
MNELTQGLSKVIKMITNPTNGKTPTYDERRGFEKKALTAAGGAFVLLTGACAPTDAIPAGSNVPEISGGLESLGLKPEQFKIISDVLRINKEATQTIPDVKLPISICGDSRACAIPQKIMLNSGHELTVGPDLAARVGAQPMEVPGGKNVSIFMDHGLSAEDSTGCGLLGGVDSYYAAGKTGLKAAGYTPEEIKSVEEVFKNKTINDAVAWNDVPERIKNGVDEFHQTATQALTKVHGDKFLTKNTVSDIQRLVDNGISSDSQIWVHEGALQQAQLTGGDHTVIAVYQGHADNSVTIKGAVRSDGTTMTLDELLQAAEGNEDIEIAVKYLQALNQPTALDETLTSQAPTLNVISASKNSSLDTVFGQLAETRGILFKQSILQGAEFTQEEAMRMVAGMDYSLSHLPQKGFVLVLEADNPGDMAMLRYAWSQSGALEKFNANHGVVLELMPGEGGVIEGTSMVIRVGDQELKVAINSELEALLAKGADGESLMPAEAAPPEEVNASNKLKVETGGIKKIGKPGAGDEPMIVIANDGDKVVTYEVYFPKGTTLTEAELKAKIPGIISPDEDWALYDALVKFGLEPIMVGGTTVALTYQGAELAHMLPKQPLKINTITRMDNIDELADKNTIDAIGNNFGTNFPGFYTYHIDADVLHDISSWQNLLWGGTSKDPKNGIAFSLNLDGGRIPNFAELLVADDTLPTGLLVLTAGPYDENNIPTSLLFFNTQNAEYSAISNIDGRWEVDQPAPLKYSTTIVGANDNRAKVEWEMSFQENKDGKLEQIHTPVKIEILK